jgi:hypothetical protein
MSTNVLKNTPKLQRSQSAFISKPKGINVIIKQSNFGQ